MSNPKLRQTLRALITTIEELYLENTAMSLVLTGCPDAYTRKTWQRDVQKLVSEPGSEKAVRSVFAPIHALINEVNDEAAAIELLAKLPVVGKPS